MTCYEANCFRYGKICSQVFRLILMQDARIKPNQLTKSFNHVIHFASLLKQKTLVRNILLKSKKQ